MGEIGVRNAEGSFAEKSSFAFYGNFKNAIGLRREALVIKNKHASKKADNMNALQ